MRGYTGVRKAMSYLHDMDLHDQTNPTVAWGPEIFVLRVPGGWIYTIYEHSVFVPLHDEYKHEHYLSGKHVTG